MFDSGLDGEKIRASDRELVPRSVRGVPFMVARSFVTTFELNVVKMPMVN